MCVCSFRLGLRVARCWTVRRRRKERASPVLFAWMSTSVHTAVSPAVTFFVSRVSAQSPRTGQQTHPALSAAPSSHKPLSTEVSAL